MPENDRFLQTINAIYASGLDSARVSEALEATSSLLGGVGATLEVISKPARRPIEFWSAGLPAVSGTQYVAHFAALNPRIPHTLRQRAGEVAWDRQLFDEAQMSRDPFYAEFLPELRLRYFVSVVLEQTPDRLAVVAVQRTRKQGHVGNREITLMRRLYPHYRRAYDVAAHLRYDGDHAGILENALELLTYGVALLRADGEIVYANNALRALAQREDGFRILDRTFEFAELGTRRCFGVALGAVKRIGDPAHDAQMTDFPVSRSGGMPAYLVSVRPLMRATGRTTHHADATIMVLVRDPLWRNAATSRFLQELFSLTNAEAHLAQALCTGTTTGVYAAERGVSLNTVYSHLKKIREKTGCKSVPDLIRRFGELNVPLRLS
ncbi:MAG: LuxR family transcriptional regulator [Pseudolabrys sp.]